MENKMLYDFVYPHFIVKINSSLSFGCAGLSGWMGRPEEFQNEVARTFYYEAEGTSGKFIDFRNSKISEVTPSLGSTDKTTTEKEDVLTLAIVEAVCALKNADNIKTILKELKKRTKDR